MSYDDRALRISHNLNSATVSGSTTTQSIKGPAGRRGRLAAISASITTTTVGAAVAVQVGVTGNLTKFGNLLVGAQTAPEAITTEIGTRNAAGMIDIADTTDEVLVTVTAGTSGVIVPTIVFDWF